MSIRRIRNFLLIETAEAHSSQKLILPSLEARFFAKTALHPRICTLVLALLQAWLYWLYWRIGSRMIQDFRTWGSIFQVQFICLSILSVCLLWWGLLRCLILSILSERCDELVSRQDFWMQVLSSLICVRSCRLDSQSSRIQIFDCCILLHQHLSEVSEVFVKQMLAWQKGNNKAMKPDSLKFRMPWVSIWLLQDIFDERQMCISSQFCSAWYICESTRR